MSQSIKLEKFLSPILCRICATEQEESMNNLITSIHNGLYFIDMLQHCLQRSIDKDNRYPLSVCLGCTSNLIAAYNFNVLCNDSDRKFKDMMDSECDSLERKIDVITDETDDIKPSHFIDCTAIDIPNRNCDEIEESFTSIETEAKNVLSLKSHVDDETITKRASRSNSKRQNYQCYRCKARYKRIFYLRQHMIYHYTDEELWKCSDCKKRFTQRKSLLKHLYKHTNAVCEYCTSSVKFTTLRELKHHCLSAHNDRLVTYKCDLCSRKFILNQLLLIHMHNHRDSQDKTRRFNCNVCNDTTFNTEQQLKVHTRTVHTTYLCSECGKIFKNNSLLASHQKVHKSDKPFVCTECPSRFKWKVALTYHMTIHQTERKHVCETCGMSFTTRSAMKGHMRIHTGERPFACDKCSKRFYRSTHLKRHYLSHTGEKPYLCKFCEKGFRQSAQLNKHMRTHVGENTYQCDLCPTNFRLKVDLKKHFHEHYQNKNATDVTAGSDT